MAAGKLSFYISKPMSLYSGSLGGHFEEFGVNTEMLDFALIRAPAVQVNFVGHVVYISQLNVTCDCTKNFQQLLYNYTCHIPHIESGPYTCYSLIFN